MAINTLVNYVKFYSTKKNITATSQYENENNNINPPSPADTGSAKGWFITGLSDGDGSFYVSITKNNKLNIGWNVQIYFTICTGINNPNLIMLESINKYFNNIIKYFYINLENINK